MPKILFRIQKHKRNKNGNLAGKSVSESANHLNFSTGVNGYIGKMKAAELAGVVSLALLVRMLVSLNKFSGNVMRLLML